MTATRGGGFSELDRESVCSANAQKFVGGNRVTKRKTPKFTPEEFANSKEAADLAELKLTHKGTL